MVKEAALTWGQKLGEKKNLFSKGNNYDPRAQESSMLTKFWPVRQGSMPRARRQQASPKGRETALKNIPNYSLITVTKWEVWLGPGEVGIITRGPMSTSENHRAEELKCGHAISTILDPGPTSEDGWKWHGGERGSKWPQNGSTQHRWFDSLTLMSPGQRWEMFSQDARVQMPGVQSLLCPWATYLNTPCLRFICKVGIVIESTPSNCWEC